MKKLLHCLCNILIFAGTSFSQNLIEIGPGTFILEDSIPTRTVTARAAGNIDIPQPFAIPPSPQSQIFDRVYVDYPMAEYYGLPEISIPLCEISIKGVTIPVTLNYHAGGIKYMQYDGEVAAGWSINAAGYRITRSIYGKSDFDFTKKALSDSDSRYIDPQYYNSDLTIKQHWWKRDSFLARIACINNRWGIGQYGLGKILSENMPSVGLQDWFLDGEYDQFTFNTPTTTGHFVIDDLWAFNGYWTGAGLDSSKEKITINRNDGQIIDSYGNKYTFGGSNATETTWIEAEEAFRETGWALTKITDIYGDEITFGYQRDLINQKRNLTDPKYLTATFSPAEYALFPSATTDIGLNTKVSNASEMVFGYGGRNGMYPNAKIYTPVIQNIKAPGMAITFNRDKTGDTSGNSPSLIKSIEINDKNSAYYKKIVFTQRKYIASSADAGCWHYLLDSIHIEDRDGNIEKRYVFDYYDKNTPQAALPYPDQWGYYKFGGNSSKINLHNDFNSEEFLSSTSIFQTGHQQTHSSSFYNRYGHWNTTVPRGASLGQVGKIFSLKSITYPTGGITEFEYGHNQYYCPEKKISTQGGGLRVEKIIHRESPDDPYPIETLYDYAEGVPSFPLISDNFQSTTMGLEDITFLGDIDNLDAKVFVETKTFSMEPTGDVPVQDFKVMYPEVTVIKQRLEDNYQYVREGKTVSSFLIPKKYTTTRFGKSNSGERLIWLDHEGDVLHDSRQPSPTYSPRSSIISVTEYYPGYEPKLQKRAVFNHNNDTVRFEQYDYYDTTRDSIGNARQFRGLKVSQKVFWGPLSRMHDTPFAYRGYNKDNQHDLILGHPATYWDRYYAYYFIENFFEFMHYSISTGKYLPKSKTVADYDLNGRRTVVISEDYQYDHLFRLIRSNTTDSDNKTVSSFNTYPYTAERALWNTNMLNTLLETYTTHDGMETSRLRYHFEPTSIFPSYLQASVSGPENFRTFYRYRYTNSPSNLAGYEDIKGFNTSILWSYENQHPVLIIENLSYEKVESLLGAGTINALKQNRNPSYDTLLSYAEIISKNNPEAMVTINTYTPGLGLLSVTDPSGRITHYEYDSFGRLFQNKFQPRPGEPEFPLQQYNYNYRNK